MRRLLIFLSTISFAQQGFYVDICRIYGANYEPYIEIYYAISNKWLHFAPVKKGFQATAQITTQIFNQDSELVYIDRFWLKSPIVPDTSPVFKNRFLLAVKRLEIAPGNYRLQVEVIDALKENPKRRVAVKDFSIVAADTFPLFSDVLWLKSWKRVAKSESPFFRDGLLYEPLITNSVFVHQDTLWYWVNLYGLDKVYQAPYVVVVSVTDGLSQKPIEGFSKIFRPKLPKPYRIILGTIDVSLLPTQSYWLNISIQDNGGRTLYQQRYPFYVYNEKEYRFDQSYEALYDRIYGYPEEQLDEYIAALQYISTQTEIEMAKSLRTFSEKKRFFYAFWERRRASPEDPPDKAWRSYLARFNYANEHFTSSLRPGWQTDRGRVLLKYGPPDDEQVFLTETDKYPYIIWTYNRLGNQSNVYFVFYDPDLGTNEFPLLHSTLKGEPYNANWRLQLMKVPLPNYGLDPELSSPTEFKDDKVFPSTSGMPR